MSWSMSNEPTGRPELEEAAGDGATTTTAPGSGMPKVSDLDPE